MLPAHIDNNVVGSLTSFCVRGCAVIEKDIFSALISCN